MVEMGCKMRSKTIENVFEFLRYLTPPPKKKNKNKQLEGRKERQTERKSVCWEEVGSEGGGVEAHNN
jgi:hypothetical protein